MSIAATTLTRETRKAETRHALVEAASDLFATQGIEATTLDEVAARVGLTKGAVYAHFRNKAELVEEVLDAASAVIEGNVLVDPDLSLAERLAVVGAQGAALVPKIPRRTILLNLEYLLYVLRNPGRHKRVLRESRRVAREGGAELEKAARDRNEGIPVPGRELIALLNAVGFGLVIELTKDRDAITTETIEKFFAALGYGLQETKAVNALLSTRPSR